MSYNKAYYEAHKEQYKAKMKDYRQAHKEQRKEYKKAWCEANKDEIKAYSKAWREANKESEKAKKKAWREANKEACKAYQKDYDKLDINSFGQTKASIRLKSRRILKQMNLKIPGYQIHHCFGYDDPSKFIYISRALHRKIHAYLRDNNIPAATDHWMAIRDIVNDTDEFVYIKC